MLHIDKMYNEFMGEFRIGRTRAQHVYPEPRASVEGPTGPTGPSTGGGVVLLTQDIPLATLQAAGAVTRASFNIDGLLPSNARVFPSTAEVQIVTPLASGATLREFFAVIQGGNLPAGSALSFGTVSNAVGVAGGGANSSADLAGLCADQGGQQLSITIDLTPTPGVTFSSLTAGDLIAKILYVIAS